MFERSQQLTRSIPRMGESSRNSGTLLVREFHRNIKTGAWQVRTIKVVVLPIMSWRMRECP